MKSFEGIAAPAKITFTIIRIPNNFKARSRFIFTQKINLESWLPKDAL